VSAKKIKSNLKRLKKKSDEKMLISHRFSITNVVLFSVAFTAIAGFIVFRSFALDSPKTLYVATNGSDSNTCLSSTSACKTFNRAYEAASQGDTVQVAAGTYVPETMQGKPKGNPDADEADVLFRPASGAVVNTEDLTIAVPHIEFQNINLWEFAVNYDSRDGSTGVRGGDVTIRNSDGYSFTIRSAYNVRVYNSDIGPQTNPHQPGDQTQDTIYIGHYPTDSPHHPKNILLEGNVIHDVVRPFDGAHSDCLQITAGENVTVRGNRFFNCGDTNFIPKNDQGPMLNYLIENNWLDDVPNNSQEINFYDMDSRPCGKVVIRNNSVLGTIRTDHVSECDLEVVGNIVSSLSSTSCSTNTADVLEYNVIESGVACGNNYLINGSAQYVNPTYHVSTQDLHLRSTSPAIGRGHPSNYPSLDFDLGSRPNGTLADAGADEYGSSGTGSTPPPTTPPPTTPPPTTPPPSSSTTISLNLINSSTDSVISSLTNGITINLASVSTLNVQAIPSSSVGSIKFSLDGADYRTENGSPYSLAGDTGGDYASWTPSVGSHTLSTTAYSGSSASGSILGSSTVSFTVTNTSTNPPPPPPTTKTGDLNSDGLVNIFDMSILLSNYGKTTSQASNPACDLNSDGNINIFDLSMMLSLYGT
jgi:hypothetical protein